MAKFISEVDGCLSLLATCRTVDDNSFLFDLALNFECMLTEISNTS